MKKITIVLMILLALVIIAGIGGLVWYTTSLKAPAKSEEIYLVTIPEGKGISAIAELLENEGVIKSAIACKIYCRINNVTKLQAGNYEINAQFDTPTILAQIAGGSVVSKSIPDSSSSSVTIS